MYCFKKVINNSEEGKLIHIEPEERSTGHECFMRHLHPANDFNLSPSLIDNLPDLSTYLGFINLYHKTFIEKIETTVTFSLVKSYFERNIPRILFKSEYALNLEVYGKNSTIYFKSFLFIKLKLPSWYWNRNYWLLLFLKDIFLEFSFIRT